MRSLRLLVVIVDQVDEGREAGEGGTRRYINK